MTAPSDYWEKIWILNKCTDYVIENVLVLNQK